ncbi:MAG: peptide ABC transporter ATP-binding protein, partial [Hyphomicrobiales bacterium]|nr:peptide ABC transporter ATP-binding protein [Hyphomicrobiales bacterium]
EALLSAVPIADTRVKKKRIVLEGDIPSAMNPPPGCPFQTRCRWKSRVAGNRCETQVPAMQEISPGNWIKCHLATDVLAEMEPVITVDAPPARPPVAKKQTAKKQIAKKPAARQRTAKPQPAVAAGGGQGGAASLSKPAAKKDDRPPRMRKPARPDDLKRISGVGPKLEGVLNELGIYTFGQIAQWKKAERDWVDGYLNFKGRIDRDGWVKQAKALAKRN